MNTTIIYYIIEYLIISCLLFAIDILCVDHYYIYYCSVFKFSNAQRQRNARVDFAENIRQFFTEHSVAE